LIESTTSIVLTKKDKSDLISLNEFSENSLKKILEELKRDMEGLTANLLEIFIQSTTKTMVVEINLN